MADSPLPPIRKTRWLIVGAIVLAFGVEGAGWLLDKNLLPLTISLIAMIVSLALLCVAVANAPASAFLEEGRINWDLNSQLLVVSGGPTSAQVHGYRFRGISPSSIVISEAYIVSGLTGQRKDLVVNVQPPEVHISVFEAVNIPLAQVDLEAKFEPALSVREFLDQWGEIRLTVGYNGVTFQRTFDEACVRQELQRHVPNAFGPRVTSKEGR